MPKDVKRLRISGAAFRSLLLQFEVPPQFLTSLLNLEVPSGPCGRHLVKLEERIISDFWYTVPIRAIVPCTESQKSHALSAAGRNQMNPSQYLHLNNCGVDIRPSKIVMYHHHDSKAHSTNILCFDFQDGRWHSLAEEPLVRAKEVLKISASRKEKEHAFFMHNIILTSAANWWRTALKNFNTQLIEYVCPNQTDHLFNSLLTLPLLKEKMLLQELDDVDSQGAKVENEINTALHTMAAHLHRYKAGIGITQDVIIYLTQQLTDLCPHSSCSNEESAWSISNCRASLEMARTNVVAIQQFISELEVKTDTVISLVGVYLNLNMWTYRR
jgi:hypothetical protein